MTGIQVVAFDCDGVLFDTRKANTAFYNRILAHLNRPPMTPEQFAFAHMHTVDRALGHLFSDARDYRIAQEFRQRMGYGPFVDQMEIEPGLRDLLKRLRPRYRTAIATNRTDTMGHVLERFGLTGMFDLVVTAQDVARPKPHPDSLERLLAYFRIAACEAIYIGDSDLDRQAARAAGIPFVAYDNPALPAAHHIQRLDQLDGLLGVKAPEVPTWG